MTGEFRTEIPDRGRGQPAPARHWSSPTTRGVQSRPKAEPIALATARQSSGSWRADADAAAPCLAGTP